MPDPPQVGLLTRYVFENPYPLGVVLLVVGAAIALRALSAERADRLKLAGALAAVGAAVLAVGALVVTSGERARGVTLALVEAAVAGDVDAAAAHFADEAMLSFGLPTNPGYPADEIHRRLQGLANRNRIASNRITMLEAYSASGDEGIVHLACSTTLENGFGPVPTRWVLRIERQDDGTWQVSHVTWVSFAGRTPRPNAGL